MTTCSSVFELATLVAYSDLVLINHPDFVGMVTIAISPQANVGALKLRPVRKNLPLPPEESVHGYL
jgi:hypothetical protein